MKWLTQELRVEMTEQAPPKQAPPRKRFNRGQFKVLIALALVTLGIYGALTVVFAQRERTPTPIAAEPASDNGLELQVARETAQAWAVGWRSDAQLVAAIARWQLADGDRLAPGQPSWAFSFYSPAAGQVQTITVDQAGVQPVRQVSVSKAPVPVTADWRLTGDDLLLIFMAYGGEEFIREHTHVSLHFRLARQDGGRPIWYLSAIAPEARQSFMIGVDALSRQVVRTS